MKNSIYIVIMAGGRGTRFWPRSITNKPKQLIPIIGNDTMIQSTVKRFKNIVPLENIYIITGKHLITETIKQLSIPKENIIAEPEARNTAPCIGFMTSLIYKKNKNALIGVFPSDHHIKNINEFEITVKNSFDIANKTKKIVTLGLKPDHAATGYGYIETGEISETKPYYHNVISFREKPDLKTAEKFFKSNNYVWNSGMFIFPALKMINEFKKHLPLSYKTLVNFLNANDPLDIIEENFKNMEKISIDFGIMEKTDEIVAIKTNISWNDVGNFNSVYKLIDHDENENCISDKVFFNNSSGCYVHSDNLPVFVESTKDIMVIVTNNAIMVCDRNKAENIGKLVKEMEKSDKYKKLL